MMTLSPLDILVELAKTMEECGEELITHKISQHKQSRSESESAVVVRSG
jgi:hypothetical protein